MLAAEKMQIQGFHYFPVGRPRKEDRGLIQGNPDAVEPGVQVAGRNPSLLPAYCSSILISE
jgi:hypothetical protein